MNKNKKTLLIIDGNAIIHRSFHALPPSLRTKDGVLVNAVYGFTSFLLKSLAEFKPEYVILTLDKAGPTFRHEAYSEYKATRTKAADELYEQIPLVKKVASSFDIPIFEKSGFEADDIIGSLARQIEENKEDVSTIIMTGDLDTLQLVTKETKVYTMSRGISESVLYDINKVKERYQLSPKQIIDYKALAGDSSDNIPGAKGIGAKTATELLLKYKNIEGVYKAVEDSKEEIKERTKKLLIESKENVFMSKELATIDVDAPVEASLEDAHFSLSNFKDIVNIFHEMQFKSLIKRLEDLKNYWQGYKNEEKKEKEKGGETYKNDYNFLNEKNEIDNFLEKAKKDKLISLSVKENSEQEITAIAISLENGKTYFLNKQAVIKKELKTLLEDNEIKKIGYNLKLSYKILKKKQIELKNVNFDTLIAAYLLNPGQRNYDLESLAFSELGITHTEKEVGDNNKKESKQLSLDLEDDSILSKKACLESDLSFKLYKKLKENLKKEELYKIFKEIEMPLVVILAEMEINGIKINKKILKDLEIKIDKKLESIREKVYKEAGKEFNINSTKQLKEILFSDLEIPTKGIKKTKTGFSTADDELNKMKELHPIITLIQDYREFTKLQSTYIRTLPELINKKTKKIHTHFTQTITSTGRLSSYDPNLQNIPTKTKEGREIRKAFVAEEGYILASFDYSQIELRLAAHFSEDEKMLSAFKSEKDIHTATAAEINEVKLDEVTKTMRQEAKAVNFGILYGQGPHGLSQTALINYKKAKEFIDKYFAKYPDIKNMVDNFIKQAQTQGYASTMFGRKRPLPDINSSMPILRRSAERMAINTPLQGTAADIIKKAMIKIKKKLLKSGDIKIILQVHDELIFEIKEDKLEKYSKEIIKIMQEDIELKVPILVEYSSGKNWNDLK